MQAIIIAGARLSHGADSQPLQHLLDALDFDPAMIIHAGGIEGDWSIYFGLEAARFDGASLELCFDELDALRESPAAQAALARVRERWAGDPEALSLRAQLGLAQSHQPSFWIAIEP